MTKNEHDQRIQENKQQRENVDQKLFTLIHLRRKGVSTEMGKSYKSNNNKLYFSKQWVVENLLNSLLQGITETCTAVNINIVTHMAGHTLNSEFKTVLQTHRQGQ